MSDGMFMLIVAAVFFFGTVLTIKRGWFPFPFFRVRRDREAPVFWLSVAISTALGVALVAAALFSN